ncbi:prenyltransferase/squalene oxidase repeat-containing protein [Jonesia quinghaiensis]|uniref:prenyltransferase/squalene oxidase repeat-containing protein n=1 Tax=Jonesia quinghaiensis TaxID=262806 RepID=UPI000491AAED|nr:prenyltransferase/squalene oxidase repeat-containing protein [Jonesia quinghaiensis]
MLSHSRGLVGVVTVGALALAGCAQPQETPEPTIVPSALLDQETLKAASWLESQISESGIVQSDYQGATFPDYGLTLDTALALTAVAGVQDLPVPTAVVNAAEALATQENVLAYTTFDKDRYVGATAKLAASLDALGYDPSDVAGIDLIAQLEALQMSSGQFADHAQEDYSNTVSQSWGVIALAQYGEDPSSAADFLVRQQCDDGGFSMSFVSADTEDECISDPDATAFAVSALAVYEESFGEGARRAGVIDGARDYFDTTANEETVGRSWSDALSGEPSVNTTAVVTVALADAHDDTSSSAQAYLLSLLHNSPNGVFQVAGLDDTRATAQGVLSLSGLSFTDLFANKSLTQE